MGYARKGKKQKKEKTLSEQYRQSLKNYHNRLDIKQKFAERQSKKVVCVETQTIYKSITDAAKQNNIKIAGISKCCIGMLKTYKKLHWKFIKEN